MNCREVPILLIRPSDRDYPFVSVGAHDLALEQVAKNLFAVAGVDSRGLVEPPVPNQDYRCFWLGAGEEIEVEVMRAEGPHAGKFPFWALIGQQGKEGWSDHLVEQAHSLADKLTDIGWRCKVKGYVSATADAPL